MSYDEDEEEFEEYDDEDDEYEGYDDDDEFEEVSGRSLKPSGRVLKILGVILALVCLGGVGAYAFQPSKPASELWPEYVKAYKGVTEMAQKNRKTHQSTDFRAVHELMLKWIDAGYMPSCSTRFVTLEVKSKSDKVAEFQVAACPIRIGNDEDWAIAPLDGHHAAAAAEITGYTIPTVMLVEEIRKKASEDGGKLPFLSDRAITQNPMYKDGIGAEWRRWTQFKRDVYKSNPDLFMAKTTLLRKWMEKEDFDAGQLCTCGSKEVVWPMQGLTAAPAKKIGPITVKGAKTGRLEIYSGCKIGDYEAQRVSGGFHWARYHDYSHAVRFVKTTVSVDGESMTFKAFFTSVEHASDFGFSRIVDKDQPYEYSDDLKKLVEELK